jgi:hypothetical protein
VGQAVYLTFTDDADWRAAINEISVDGVVLDVEQYLLDNPGQIIINADVFKAAGDYEIVVKAAGYYDTCVTQAMSSPLVITEPDSGKEFTKGEQVTIRGTVYGVLTTVSVTVTGLGSEGEIVDVVYGPVDVEVVDGYFETSFQLETGVKAGTYTITVEAVGLKVASQFKVQGEGSDKPDPGKDDGEVVLTVTGSGVAREVDFTRADLDEMKPYELTYTAINTWPTKKWYVGKGVKLNDLLNEAGVKNAGLIKFTATDGFTMTFTGKQLLRDTRYRFPNFKDGESDADGHLIGSTAGQTPVDTIIGLVSAEGTDDSSYMNALNAPLLMLGQRAVTEQNGQSFVKNVRTIEVLDASPSQWAEPTATADEEPDEEGKFPAGTLVELSSTFNDDDKVHYTTDNSNPTIESPIYNWIASRWWSTRGEDTVKKINKPIELTQDTVIKARTIGPGKEDSAVATFSYKVKEAPPGSSEKFFPSQGGKVKHEDKVEVDIPPNAIQETDEVEVKIQPLVIYPDLPADFKLASEVYQFSVGDDKNYSFAREVTIKFSLGPEIVNENAAPAIHYYDEDQEQWVNIGGTVSDGTITIEVDHFGKFAVMVEKMMELEEPEEPEEPDMAIKLTDIKDHWARKNIERLVLSSVV